MKLKKLKETVDLANTSDKKLEKMSWKEKQKVYKAKSSLCRVVWNSGEQGTYRKPKKNVTK